MLLKWYICESKQRPGFPQWAQPGCSLCPRTQPSNSSSFHLTEFWPNSSAGCCNSASVTHPFVVLPTPSSCQTCHISWCQAERAEGREGFTRDFHRAERAHAVFPFIWPTLSHSSLALALSINCLKHLVATIPHCLRNPKHYFSATTGRILLVCFIYMKSCRWWWAQWKKQRCKR